MCVTKLTLRFLYRSMFINHFLVFSLRKKYRIQLLLWNITLYSRGIFETDKRPVNIACMKSPLIVRVDCMQASAIRKQQHCIGLTHMQMMVFSKISMEYRLQF